MKETMDKYQEEQAQKTNQMLQETEEIKRGMKQLEDEKEELFEQLQEVLYIMQHRIS